MSYCPLISHQKQYCSEMPCMGEDCALWSHSKDGCLVRIALLKYTVGMTSDKEVSREDELRTQIEILKQQLQAVSMGFPIMNFNTEYKSGLANAKYPPDPLIGGDTINAIDKDWSGLQGGL